MRRINPLTQHIFKHPILWIAGILIAPMASLSARLILAYGSEFYTAELLRAEATLNRIAVILLAALAGSIASSMIEYTARYMFAKFVVLTENSIKQDLFAKLLLGKYKEINRLDRGEILTRYNTDAGLTTKMVSWDIFSIVYPIIMGAGYLLSIYMANWLIGTVMLILILLVIGLNLLFVKRKIILEKQVLIAKESFTQINDSALQGKMSIRQMSAGEMICKKITEEARVLYQREEAIVKLDAQKAITLEFLATICSSMMVPLACILTALNVMNLPNVMLIAQLCRSVIVQTRNLGLGLSAFGGHSVAYKRLNDILEISEEERGGSDKKFIDSQDILRFQGAKITYGKNVILSDMNFRIQKGEILVLLGPSGSGKSSIIKALLRLIDHSGQIMMNGMDINEIPLTQLRKMISYVPEQSDLFDANVLENIHYGNPEAGPDEVEKVLELSALSDEKEIGNRKAGENGDKLSGGQRQRVAIARALLKDAELLVLDEPTAALDNISEKKILETCKKLKKQGKTIIIITHRETTMRIADRIMLIQNKKVIDNVPLDEAIEDLKNIKNAVIKK